MEGGLFTYLFVSHKSISSFKMGESRLKMNLLYTSSPVKGLSVQCSWCLQCVSTRDMLQFGCVSDGLNRSRHGSKFSAALSDTELIYSIMNAPIQALLYLLTGYDEGKLKHPIYF